MSKPEPSLEQCFAHAKYAGIDHVEDAWNEYTRHYTIFFYIAEYAEQTKRLREEMYELGILIDATDSMYKYMFADMSVEEALELINKDENNPGN